MTTLIPTVFLQQVVFPGVCMLHDNIVRMYMLSMNSFTMYDSVFLLA